MVRENSDTEAGGQRETQPSPSGESMSLNGGANALSYQSGLFQWRFGKNDHEFIAPVTSDRISVADL